MFSNSSLADVEEDLMTVSVLLDGDESTLCFIDEEIVNIFVFYRSYSLTYYS